MSVHAYACPFPNSWEPGPYHVPPKFGMPSANTTITLFPTCQCKELQEQVEALQDQVSELSEALRVLSEVLLTLSKKCSAPSP
jgi:hypothetical protein